jgi:hypothetical protein
MTIDKHLALLADSPDAKAIYELITQQITNSTNNYAHSRRDQTPGV